MDQSARVICDNLKRAVGRSGIDDDQLEIIMNTGVILDSRFYNVEFQSDEVFGDRIFLLDINDDGIPEIVGEFLDFNIRVFDVYSEREIW